MIRYLLLFCLALPLLPAYAGGKHDFDWEIGSWNTKLKRLGHPLSGSHDWTDWTGVTMVRAVWGGKANLLELEADGPNGDHFEGLSLRLYNPEAKQWTINFANGKAGVMTSPNSGDFKNGRGEFYQTDNFGPRTILVRFVISDVTANSAHFEQAFSEDGGKSWEVNWIADDTRID
jgi:hypothetical protein